MTTPDDGSKEQQFIQTFMEIQAIGAELEAARDAMASVTTLEGVAPALKRMDEAESRLASVISIMVFVERLAHASNADARIQMFERIKGN